MIYLVFIVSAIITRKASIAVSSKRYDILYVSYKDFIFVRNGFRSRRQDSDYENLTCIRNDLFDAYYLVLFLA